MVVYWYYLVEFGHLLICFLSYLLLECRIRATTLRRRVLLDLTTATGRQILQHLFPLIISFSTRSTEVCKSRRPSRQRSHLGSSIWLLLVHFLTLLTLLYIDTLPMSCRISRIHRMRSVQDQVKTQPAWWSCWGGPYSQDPVPS